MTRYRLQKDTEDGTVTPVVSGYPEDGFASATEAAVWADTHDLDGRWYIAPMEGTCARCNGTGTVYEHHGPGLSEPLGCDWCGEDTE